MKSKQTISLALASMMAAGLLAGCGSTASSTASSAAESTAASSEAASSEAAAPVDTTAAGKVYYLNFKPEQDEAWQALAKTYTEETGVPVTVVTAASGQYETTLMSEMAKSDAPTLFQVNGPVGLANWKDYCYDLTGSKILGDLTSDSYALKDGDATVAIGYVIESYGLITNKTLLEKAGYTTDDIKSFADLKKVAEDITARKDELGFAAFTSAGMDSSSDWRFKTHLPTCPSTLSTRLTASAPRMPSRAPTWITTRTCLTCTSTTPPVLPLSWLARLAMTAATSSWTMRLSSTRTVLGNIPTSSAMASPSPMTT